MCWASIMLKHAQSGKNMTYISSKIALLVRRGIMSDSDKIEIYALLLQQGIYQEVDLDTFVTSGWITTQEKEDILNEPIIEC